LIKKITGTVETRGVKREGLRPGLGSIGKKGGGVAILGEVKKKTGRGGL